MNTVRIKFQKTGLSMFFSHLDLQKVMQRALKISGLPVWYSKGFNPHIYMTFTLPLSLGHESLCESFDFRLEEELTEQQILKAMEGTLPDGIILTAAGAPDYDASQIKYALYRIKMYGEKDVLANCIAHFKDSEEIIVTKTSKKKSTDINIKTEIKDLKTVEAGEDNLTFTALFPAGTTYNLNPGLLLEYFGNRFGIDANGCDVLRVNLLDENLEILQ